MPKGAPGVPEFTKNDIVMPPKVNGFSKKVYILGVGLHPFGRFPDSDFGELGRVAVNAALGDAGIGWRDIPVMYATAYLNSAGWGTDIATAMGATGIPVVNIEAACCSTAAGIVQAASAISSGAFDVALCVGGEKQSRGFIPTVGEPHWKRKMGLGVYPAYYAQLAQRYMHKYGATREQLAWVSMKSHKNASLSPYAHYQNMPDLTVDEILNARPIVDPYSILMIAPTSEGAGAVIVGSEEVVKKYGIKNPIEIASSTLTSELYEWDQVLYPPNLLRMCAKQAYEKAGIGPEDIDIAMIQDGMPIGEIEGLEQLGFCEEGQGAWMADPEKRTTWLDGDFPVNTDGGYMSRGNCIGATGAASIAEMVWQLRGEAGPRQVSKVKPKTALAHNMGAGIQCAITILKK